MKKAYTLRIPNYVRRVYLSTIMQDDIFWETITLGNAYFPTNCNHEHQIWLMKAAERLNTLSLTWNGIQSCFQSNHSFIT